METQKIIVVGDIMIDNNQYCTSNRLAPEAPVPIFKLVSSDYVLGGCGNVANNIKKLHDNVLILSIIGNDEWGTICKNNITKLGLIDCTIVSTNRITTVKTRQFVSNKLVNRLDIEMDTNISEIEENLILDKIKNLSNVGGIVLSDYNKGVLTPSLSKKIINYCNLKNIPTFVDPKVDYTKYINCFLIKPNKSEAAKMLGYDVSNSNLHMSIKKMAKLTSSKYVLLTMSEKGMILYNAKSGEHQIFNNTYINKTDVVDVTGAGDMVLSIVSFFNIIKNDILKGCEIANKMSQYAVTKSGTCTIDSSMIKYITNDLNEIKYFYEYDNEKMLKLFDIIKGKKITFTNGCFDIMHVGHITYLAEAKKQGDILIVGLNSDKSVKKNKGEHRPINTEINRAELLLALKSVDYVVIFDSETPEKLIKNICPDTLIKGGDYDPDETNPESKKYIIGKKYALDTKVIDFVEGYSTTKTIENVMRNKIS